MSTLSSNYKSAVGEAISKAIPDPVLSNIKSARAVLLFCTSLPGCSKPCLILL